MTPQHTTPYETTAVTASLPTTADHDLLHHLAEGDATAFWEIWEHYRETILSRRCLQWMGGNQAEAEDALSSACLKAWQKLPAYAHDISNIKGWLLQLLHNHCMDIRRAHSREHHTVKCIDDYTTLALEETMPVHESPELVLLRSEMHIALQRVLTHLPVRLREPAILRFCHELPHREIAAQLGLTPETVRKRIQQARALMQEQLCAYRDGTTGLDWQDEVPSTATAGRWASHAVAA
jgi:RNA polymerase sigma factor (sigma-70 family)